MIFSLLAMPDFSLPLSRAEPSSAQLLPLPRYFSLLIADTRRRCYASFLGFFFSAFFENIHLFRCYIHMRFDDYRLFMPFSLLFRLFSYFETDAVALSLATSSPIIT